MKKKVFWLILLLAVAVLFFIFLTVAKNKTITSTGKRTSVKELRIPKGITKRKNIKSNKKGYDVFKPEAKNNEKQESGRPRSTFEYRDVGEDDLLLM